MLISNIHITLKHDALLMRDSLNIVLLLTHIIKSNKNTIYAYFSNEYFLHLKISIRCLRKDLLFNGTQIVGPYARLSHLVPRNLCFFSGSFQIFFIFFGEENAFCQVLLKTFLNLAYCEDVTFESYTFCFLEFSDSILPYSILIPTSAAFGPEYRLKLGIHPLDVYHYLLNGYLIIFQLDLCKKTH